MGRREDLQRTIRRAERELAKLDALPDFDGMREGSVLALAVKYPAGQAYTYVGLKAGARWHFTGRNSPNGATGEQVIQWLTSDTRQVIAVTKIGDVQTVEVPTVDLGEILSGNVQEVGRAFRESGGTYR